MFVPINLLPHYIRKKTVSNRGDTIVEVLIAVAIIGSVLTGAFTVTQKSSHAVRSSQEHSEMLQILQSQVEVVRALAMDQAKEDEPTAPTTGVYSTSPTFFCVDSATRQRVNQTRLANVLPPIADDTFVNYEKACKVGNEKRYNLAISYDSTSKLFTFNGRWDRVGGGKNQEKLYYRILPAPVVVAPPPPPSAASGPTGGGTGGKADIKSSCKYIKDTTICEPSKDPPSYRWVGGYVNNSKNTGKTAVSCVWDWDDGTTSTTACNFNDKISHTWPAFPVAPFPADCEKQTKVITLTVKLNDGSTAVKTRAIGMPGCY